MIVFHYITMNDVEKCIASFLKHLEGGKVSSSNIRLAFQLQVTKIVPGYSLLPSCNCKAESRKSCILLPLLVALMSQSPLPLLPPDLLYLVCAPGLENSKWCLVNQTPCGKPFKRRATLFSQSNTSLEDSELITSWWMNSALMALTIIFITLWNSLLSLIYICCNKLTKPQLLCFLTWRCLQNCQPPTVTNVINTGNVSQHREYQLNNF